MKKTIENINPKLLWPQKNQELVYALENMPTLDRYSMNTVVLNKKWV